MMSAIRIVIILFLFSLSMGVSCQSAEKSTATKVIEVTGKAKNIVFIAVDDLKPLLNNYGFTQMHTPNFDRLARMGTSFQNAQVQYAVCGPSRASIMTAAYPDRTKVWDLHTDFRKSAPDLMSMPEYLITQGYETTAVGKIYHKGSTAPGHDGKSWSISHSLPKNFDPAYGEPAFSYYQNPETKAQMEKLVAEAHSKGKKGKQRGYVFKRLKPSTESMDVSDEAYQDGLYTKEAIKRLAELSAGNKPFFLGIGYQKPHLPFIAPKKYWDLYDRNKIDLSGFRELSDGTPKIAYHSFGELRAFSDVDNDLKVGDQLSEEKQRELIHGYMACVSYIDAQIGKVLDAMEKLNLTKNTVVMLWGDHGYHLGDHSLWCKHSNFEQATRIPLMFAGPGIAKSVRSTVPVELVDVFPTLFDLCGVQIPAQAQGKSLVPLMDGNDATGIETDYAISQYRRRKDIMGYSIRTERYRYTEWHEKNYRSFKPYREENIMAVELYDYQSDPLETKNWAKEKSYSETVSLLKGKLKKHLETPRK